MKKNAQRFARELKEDAAESANVAAENTKAENATLGKHLTPTP
jgi:hypothetical protein